ncbi:MAG TPA: choice-of-anchor A family protein [Methylovorus sp.]|nr:choice-of-anchor A family protein [Methylovorus sp.]
MKLLSMVLITAAMFTQHAVADTVDLGVASNYNVFVFDSYKSTGWSSIGGALAVGGNADISNSSISNSANNPYGLVVGGNLTKSYGGVNGTTWVGGAVNKPQWDYYNNYSSGAAPIDFTAAKTSFSTLSDKLAATASTGTVSYSYGSTGNLTGTGSSVEFFSVNASDLTNISNWSFANVLANATLIINVSGSSASLTGGWSGFSSYNVLFNFYDATTVNLSNISFAASILATDATITGSGGSFSGTAIANSWSNSLTVTNRAFSGFEMANPSVSTVPEPNALILLIMGILMILGYRQFKNRL